MRFNFMKFIGIFAILAMVCLAAPPGAMASDGLFIDNQSTATFSVAGDGGSMIIKPNGGDILAIAPSVPASGMKNMGFAAVASAEQWTASESYSVAKGGDATASVTKPRLAHTKFI